MDLQPKAEITRFLSNRQIAMYGILKGLSGLTNTATAPPAARRHTIIFESSRPPNDILNDVDNGNFSAIPVPEGQNDIGISWFVESHSETARVSRSGCNLRIIDDRTQTFQALRFAVEGSSQAVAGDLIPIVEQLNYPVKIVDQNGGIYENPAYLSRLPPKNFSAAKSRLRSHKLSRTTPGAAQNIGTIVRALNRMTAQEVGQLFDTDSPASLEQVLQKYKSQLPHLKDAVTQLGDLIRKNRVNWQDFREFIENTPVFPNREQASTQTQPKQSQSKRYMQLDEKAALALWQKTNNLAEKIAQRRKLKISAVAATAATAAIARTLALGIDRKPSKPVNLTSTPITQEYLPPSPTTIKPTKTAVPTLTPEPTRTPSPEEQTVSDWSIIYEKYRQRNGQPGFEVDITRVISDDDFPGAADFKREMTAFLQKQTQSRDGDPNIDYRYGQGLHIYVDVSREEGLIRVTFYGDHTVPSHVANIIYYDLNAGECGTLAEKPLANGVWQQNSLKFDPQNPETCIAIARTSSDRVVGVAFLPQTGGEVKVATAVFPRTKN